MFHANFLTTDSSTKRSKKAIRRSRCFYDLLHFNSYHKMRIGSVKEMVKWVIGGCVLSQKRAVGHRATRGVDTL